MSKKQDTNTVTFDVEGLGKFTAYKEEPVEAFFMDRRKELAKVVGGRDELIKIERLYNKYADSKDESDQEIATAAFIEIKRATMYVEMKRIFKETPKDFDLDKLNVTDYDKLWMALEAARGKFRFRDSGKPQGTTQTDTDGAGAEADTKQEVPEGGQKS